MCRMGLTFAIAVAFMGGNLSHCLAQQAPDPATLENLLKPEEVQKRPANPETKATDADPVHPAGTFVRPKDGLQHPDLEKAWVEYDTAVKKASEGIKTAIAKQCEAVMAKGNLDAAEKWQATLRKFETAGEMPEAGATKAAVNAAATEYKKANDELTKAYEAVVRALTKEKRIDLARAANSEKEAIQKARQVGVNLAVGKPTRQSSVYRGTGLKHDSDLGVDGQTGPFPQPQGLVMTNCEDNSWWQVDLEGVHTLTEMRVFNRSDCCQERLSTVNVLLSDDGKRWIAIYSHKGDPIGDQLVVDLKGRKARFVRLALDKKEFLHFYECEVFGR